MWSSMRRGATATWRWLTGAERRAVDHLECREAHSRLAASLRSWQTAEVHQRMRVSQAEADLYALQVAVIAHGYRTQGLPAILDLIDRWRAKRQREPLGVMRDMLVKGDLVPVHEEGEDPRLEASSRGGDRIVDINRRGLLEQVFSRRTGR